MSSKTSGGITSTTLPCSLEMSAVDSASVQDRMSISVRFQNDVSHL